MFKILQARLHQHVNCELHMFKLDLEKAEDQRSNYQHLLDHRKTKRLLEKHPLLHINYAKAVDYKSQETVENS